MTFARDVYKYDLLTPELIEQAEGQAPWLYGEAALCKKCRQHHWFLAGKILGEIELPHMEVTNEEGITRSKEQDGESTTLPDWE